MHHYQPKLNDLINKIYKHKATKVSLVLNVIKDRKYFVLMLKLPSNTILIHVECTECNTSETSTRLYVCANTIKTLTAFTSTLFDCAAVSLILQTKCNQTDQLRILRSLYTYDSIALKHP